MNLEDFFNKNNVVDLSFFNFRNAITAAYFADKDLRILRVNDNFKKFFPVLGNVSNAYFPDVLVQLGVPGEQIENFVSNIENKGFVQIPAIHITIDGEDRVYSLLSTRTKDESFSYLNCIQGQFVDRTEEWSLRNEREQLLERIYRAGDFLSQEHRERRRQLSLVGKHVEVNVIDSSDMQALIEELRDIQENFEKRLPE